MRHDLRLAGGEVGLVLDFFGVGHLCCVSPAISLSALAAISPCVGCGDVCVIMLDAVNGRVRRLACDVEDCERRVRFK